MQRTLIPLILACFLVSCASTTGGSSWTTNLDAAYPPAKFLAAVGSGDTRRDAESDAAGALARRFSVTVKVDSVAQKRYSDLVQNGAVTTNGLETFDQRVGLQAGGQLLGMRFSDPAPDGNGRTLVVAYLEKAPAAALYRDQIGKDLDKAEALSAQAMGTNTALRAYAQADAALVVAKHAEGLLGQLRVLQPQAADQLDARWKQTAWASQRDALAAKLAYKLAIDGDADGKIADLVKANLATLSLAAQPAGLLSLTGSWAMVPVTVNKDFKSVQWTLSLNLADETGTVIATLNKTSRENGVTEADARAIAVREVGKLLAKELVGTVQGALTRMVSAN
ncbi:MAG: hypothetical protein WCG80_15305 [Spirochaetales bacterium]